MAALTEVSQWEAEIYRIEENDPVQGGESGVDNRPHKLLANRTQFLKQTLEQEIQNRVDENQRIESDRVNQDLALSIALAAEITNRENADNTKANLNGSNTNRFKVAEPVDNDDAVNLLKLNNSLSLLQGIEQLSLKHSSTIIKMGSFIYGELPAGPVNLDVSFDASFPQECLFAMAVPYNPNPTGQNAFIVTTKNWDVDKLFVVMYELAGSGDQFDAGFLWLAVGK